MFSNLKKELTLIVNICPHHVKIIYGGRKKNNFVGVIIFDWLFSKSIISLLISTSYLAYRMCIRKEFSF